MADQGTPSKKENFDKMIEESEEMSPVNFREGRKSFPGIRKAKSKALSGEYAYSVQETARRPGCLGEVSEGEGA